MCCSLRCSEMWMLRFFYEIIYNDMQRSTMAFSSNAISSSFCNWIKCKFEKGNQSVKYIRLPLIPTFRMTVFCWCLRYNCKPLPKFVGQVHSWICSNDLFCQCDPYSWQPSINHQTECGRSVRTSFNLHIPYVPQLLTPSGREQLEYEHTHKAIFEKPNNHWQK